MGKILKDEQVHQRRVTISFSAAELRELIVREAMRIAAADEGETKLSISQETQGSPSYSIDAWTASVSIVVEIGS